MAYTHEQAKKDEKTFKRMAAEADERGDTLLAGLYRVEASNCKSRVGLKKSHMPNLGPYSGSNPCYCLHCDKPKSKWVDGEECIPKKLK